MIPQEDEIGVNNTVELFFEEDGTSETMKIVTTMRGNSHGRPCEHGISHRKALLHHKVGDRVYVKVNDSYGYYVVVKKIEKTVDDGSDRLRSF